VLVSTPAPAVPADARTRYYLRHPRSSFAFFSIGAAARLVPEIVAAFPTWRERTTFGLHHLMRAVRRPMSPSQSAEWVREWSTLDVVAAARRVSAPTLVITGEAGLDRVVPVAHTLEYLRLIPDARHVVLPRTGHLGILSRPVEFARTVAGFVA
jgi:pimeloyl-ACP methyl ester carboxylesterase